MGNASGLEIIKSWPEESREAAQVVIDGYGEPDEATETMLVWHGAGPWKRVVASRDFQRHEFPVPHTDSVESFVDYRVPPEKCTPLAWFDGSVMVQRTAGEVSARCHDEQANFLALNLMHDIVTGRRDVDEARAYYGRQFADFRRGKRAPYMEQLRFQPARDTAAPDARVLSDDELRRASEEGERKRNR